MVEEVLLASYIILVEYIIKGSSVLGKFWNSLSRYFARNG
jgi:hypothetical protein